MAAKLKLGIPYGKELDFGELQVLIGGQGGKQLMSTPRGKGSGSSSEQNGRGSIISQAVSSFDHRSIQSNPC